MKVNPLDPDDPGDPAAGLLTIGDLARSTGVSTGTLRAWETRHGFPVPLRLASGHRRYTAEHIGQVRAVTERKSAGSRIEQAIEQVLAQAASAHSPEVPSIFATLRSRHPHLQVNRFRKPLLLAMSWAIEDEIGASADDPTLWGAFQKQEYYASATRRWTDLARTCPTVTVFADFPTTDLAASPRQVSLAPDAPMAREWAIVAESRSLPIALTAWELPGQDHVPDPERTFECIWTLEPDAVRAAAQVCRVVAAEDGVENSSETGQTDALVSAPPQVANVTNLVGRMMAYADRFHPRSTEPAGRA